MPVCVAGMHRSGTSMVTKFLHECGLHLGSEDRLMPAASENPEGFWEHLDIVELNEEILNQLGGGWDCPPPEPDDWTGGRLARLAPRAEAILATFEGHRHWGWKDPRASLTLPFWRALLPDLRTVVVVRHPIEVALSLRQRNGFSFALGLTLWHITNERLLAATTPDDRRVTHFDAWFGDPVPEVRRLAAFLDLPVSDETVEGFRAGATASLRHHRLTTRDLLDADVSEPVLTLYRTLCDEAGWRDTDGARPARGATAGDRPPARPPDPSPTPLEAGVGHIDRATMEVRSLRRELDDYRRALTNRDERVDDLEVALRAHEQTAIARDERIAELERNAAIHEDLRREAVALRQAVGDQTEHLDLLQLQLRTSVQHEEELRTLLASTQEQVLWRDAEIIGSLGAALHPYAPGAPSAIYYRQLIDKTRAIVAANLPPAVPTLVVSGGDDAMLQLDDRPAWHFPDPEFGVGDDVVGDGDAAVAQLETLRQRGAAFLVIPASGRSWVARYPALSQHVRSRFPLVVRDDAVAEVYALAETTGGDP